MTATGSSFCTESPSALSHWLICTSLMDSPTTGIFSSIGIGNASHFLASAEGGCFLSIPARHEWGESRREGHPKEFLLSPTLSSLSASGREGAGATCPPDFGA